MPFKPGVASNPTGKNGKAFKAALRLAVMRVDGDKTKLAKIAEALVDKAIAGDVPAINAVADRMDGKAIQALEHSGPDGGEIVTRIELVSLGASVSRTG